VDEKIAALGCSLKHSVTKIERVCRFVKYILLVNLYEIRELEEEEVNTNQDRGQLHKHINTGADLD
jgi:hypothetical protein